MNININVDLLTGIDDNIVNPGMENLNLVYKTLDFAYLKYRRYYNTETILTFNIIGGYQYLSHEDYNNCEFKGIDTYLKINKLITLTNVIFNIDIKVELNNKSSDVIIVTNKDVTFNDNYKIDVKEINFNYNKSYPLVKLINNNGNLNILSDIILKVCRQFILINNKFKAKCKLPSIESQAGTLFYSEDCAELTEIIGTTSTTSIIIKNGVTGYFYNTKTYNNFKLVDCYNNLIISNIKLNLNYEQKTILVNIRCPNIEDKQKADHRFNIGDCMLIENSEITSDNDVILSNVNNITKVNVKLTNIHYNAKSTKVKKIKDDYIVTDDDTKVGTIESVKIFHIDDTDKNINIKIPDTLKLETSELYFRKINEMSRNKIIISLSNCHGNHRFPGKTSSKNSTETLILDRTHPEILIYQDEGIFYTK